MSERTTDERAEWKQLILGMEWEDGVSLTELAEYWVEEHPEWVGAVRRGAMGRATASRRGCVALGGVATAVDGVDVGCGERTSEQPAAAAACVGLAGGAGWQGTTGFVVACDWSKQRFRRRRTDGNGLFRFLKERRFEEVDKHEIDQFLASAASAAFSGFSVDED